MDWRGDDYWGNDAFGKNGIKAGLFAYMMIVPVIGSDMGVWFMPVFLGLIFGSIIARVNFLMRFTLFLYLL